MKRRLAPVVFSLPLEKNLHRSLVWSLAIILAVVPVFAMEYWFIGVILQKAWLFYGLTTILIIGYLMLVYLHRRWLPQMTWTAKFWLVLIAIFSITTITSIQPAVSFWGEFSRMEGLVAWIYYTLFGLVAMGVLRSQSDWHTALKGVVAGGLLVDIYALAQRFGWFDTVFQLDPQRIESSLGNPVFLAGYLAVILPLVWLCGWLAKDYWRWLSFVIVVLSWGMLILTFTRGAWLAVLIGLGVSSLFYLFCLYNNHKWPRWRWISVSAVVVMIGLSLWLVMSANQTSRLFDTASLRLRLVNWRAAAAAIAERPILGWGLESFNIPLSKYYQPDPNLAGTAGFTEIHADRAHNGYLDLAVFGGMGALIAFLSILITAVVIFWWRWRQSDPTINGQALNFGFLITLVVFSAYIATAFHLITNILPVLLALAWFANVSPLTLSRSKNQPVRSRWQLPVYASGGVLAVVLLWLTVGQPASAVTLANRGIEALYAGKYDQAIISLERAIKQASQMNNPIRLHTAVLGNWAVSSKVAVPTAYHQFAVDNLDQYLQHRPQNQYAWLIKGAYHSQLSAVWPESVEIAGKSFDQAAQLAPYSAEPLFEWGNLYANLGKAELAAQKYRQALQLEPNNPLILFAIGMGELSQGDTAGSNATNRAIELGYCPPFNQVDQLAGNTSMPIQTISPLYKQIIVCGPSDQERVFAIVRLALLYKQAGDTDQAKVIARLINNYDVDFREINRFREDIGFDW